MSAARTSLDALTLQFLTWVSAKPRTYADAMGAWRTSCPRMPIWEDAIGDGLIRLEEGRRDEGRGRGPHRARPCGFGGGINASRGPTPPR
jgi:hypothetical protein